MQENDLNSFDNQEVPGSEEIRDRFPIEDDSDRLEAIDEHSAYREINADDPGELAYWASQFQLSEDELKSAIVLNGNSVQEIKKYLSI